MGAQASERPGLGHLLRPCLRPRLAVDLPAHPAGHSASFPPNTHCSGASFPERLVAFALVGSVFNAGCFAGLYWFKKVRSRGRRFEAVFASMEPAGSGAVPARLLCPPDRGLPVPNPAPSPFLPPSPLQRGLLPGTSHATDMISRDEGINVEAAGVMYG